MDSHFSLLGEAFVPRLFAYGSLKLYTSKTLETLRIPKAELDALTFQILDSSVKRE